MMRPCRKQDSAVSEIIGTVLLISIVVLAASIIAVAVFSQPQAQKIPAVSALISNQSQIVYIKHNGGDPLQNGTYRILVDGADVTSSINLPSTWSIGNTLTYTKPGTTPPSSVVIVYTGYSSTGVVLTSAYFGTGPLTTATVTATTSPVPGTSSTITSSVSGTGGTISPSGSVNVTYGSSQTFSITANSGYSVANVLIDGTSIGPQSSYTFSNVVANHTIVASFAVTTYVISATNATTGGMISPNGSISVNYGGSQTFTITANSGYHISDVSIDGSSVGAVSSYPFTSVASNHTIIASFAANTVQIITSSVSGSGGTISPLGAVSVQYGASQTFSITANSGYHISNVLIDGVSNGTISTYTFSNVVTSHTIVASFALNAPTLSGITPSSGVTGTSVSITNLAGTNFSVSGTTVVQLTMGSNTITATSVNVVSSTQITCTFSLAGAATGAWNVVMTNPDGQTATLSSGFTVTSNVVPASSVLVNANNYPGKPGYLLSGGYIQFTVTGSYYTITYGGTQHTFNNGDVVRLTLESTTQGTNVPTIYVTSSQISAFYLNNVDLTINGVDYGQSTISQIYIGSYSSFTSTLTLNVPSQSAQTEFDANGACVICNAVSSTPITVYNLGMGSGGINLGPMATIYYTGGATGYSLS